MANTYTSLHYHIVFSTKNRENHIRAEAKEWPAYIQTDRPCGTAVQIGREAAGECRPAFQCRN